LEEDKERLQSLRERTITKDQKAKAPGLVK